MGDLFGTFPQWMTMIFTLGGVVVASEGLRTWRAQLVGEGRHSTALEIATAIGNLHVEFFNSRAPVIMQWELSPAEGQEVSEFELEGERYRRALSRRYKDLHKYIMAVHNLRGKALAVLNRDCAVSLERLARKASQIESTWHTYCALMDGGRRQNTPLFDEYQAMALVDPSNPTDSLSTSFEECFQAALREIDPYLHIK